MYGGYHHDPCLFLLRACCGFAALRYLAIPSAGVGEPRLSPIKGPYYITVVAEKGGYANLAWNATFAERSQIYCEIKSGGNENTTQWYSTNGDRSTS